MLRNKLSQHKNSLEEVKEEAEDEETNKSFLRSTTAHDIRTGKIMSNLAHRGSWNGSLHDNDLK